jgi:hypothetical protein
VPAKTSGQCRRIIVAQEPDGTTTGPLVRRSARSVAPATRRAAAVNPAFQAGCPQHAAPWAVLGRNTVRRGHEGLAGAGELGTQLLDEAGREDDGLAGTGHAADVRRGGARDP